MEKCEHKNCQPRYTHTRCMDCGWIRTDADRSWGIAGNKWFQNEDMAEFYRKHGRLPEPID